MLFAKLLIAAFPVVGALVGALAGALVGVATAHPTNAGTDLTTRDHDYGTATTMMPSRAVWREAPADCSTSNFSCLVVDTDEGKFAGLPHLYCGIHHEVNITRQRVFYFNGKCEGQVSLNCKDPSSGKHSGLVNFSFMGKAGGTSAFGTDSPYIKGLTSDDQPLESDTGTVTSKVPYIDLYLGCRYS